MGSAGLVATRTARVVAERDGFETECGARLGPIDIAYETYGVLSPARDNVILALHALSGDAHAAGYSVDVNAPSAVDGVGADEKGIKPRGGLGWWDGMIGPGKAFDTRRYFVICSNVLGSCRGSTGPTSIDPATGRPYGSRFPIPTVGDMVRTQRLLLEQLGIQRLLAVSGGSLGGMQALEWAVRFPAMVASCIPIATSQALSAMGIAWNEIGRQAIVHDPAFQGGDYYDGPGPSAGLAIARMVGHVTYLSDQSMAAKFGRRLRQRERLAYDFSTEFEVESYLRHQGESFVRRFDANSYLLLSKSIDYFDLAAGHGGGSLARAVEKARARWLVMSFTSDWLYPPADSKALVEALRSVGADVRYHNLRSSYGHDAFLLEEARQTTLIRRFLRRVEASEHEAGHGTVRGG
ncbi:MAG: homoserine O-acetyltransferase [Chloroflexi bacterium]|nr:homoserine O-acetyltransferase [Chloroflexota bacterium]